MTRAGSSVRKSLDSRDCCAGSGGGEDAAGDEGDGEAQGVEVAMSEAMGVTRARTARSRRRRR